jgi:hypothetical protein
MAGAARAALNIGTGHRSRASFVHVDIRSTSSLKGNAMNRSIALGLAVLGGGAIGATAANGLHAQNRAPGAYVALDLRATNSPDVFKTLPSKTGDFDGHTA